MATAFQGEEIICSKGHVLGSVTEEVPDGEIITSGMLRVKFEIADFAPGDDGHTCRECNERITQFRGNAYTVHTARGWIGRI